jgi:hypothetical protein
VSPGITRSQPSTPAGSIVLAAAVPQLDKKHPLHGEPGTGQLGTIVGPANDEKTYWEVELDGGKKTVVLTEDELVRIQEEPAE